MTSPHPNGRVAFALWATVGALVAFGVIGILTIGIFLLGLAAVAGAALLLSQGPTRAMTGAISGAGAAPLFIAWFNRGGPGTVCETDQFVQTCSEEWSPWPFLGVGLLLVVAGVVLFQRTRPPRSAPLLAPNQ
jgi:hypothetical protein